jgi:hypothetical protein
MKNIDFLIPISIDHSDRLRNYDIVISYLKKIGAKNIYVYETYKDYPKLKDRYDNINYFNKEQDTDSYDRMKYFNFLVKQCKSPIIALYDIDVIIPKDDIIKAVDLLINNTVDVVYPYNGEFYDVPIETVIKLQQNLNTPIDLSKCILFNKNSFGGVVMFRRSVFIEGGMGNELFKNEGYADDEIIYRFRTLGYIIYRTKSPLLHLTHFRGSTSFNYNPYTSNNQKIVQETVSKNKEQLEQYIKTWSWCK